MTNNSHADSLAPLLQLFRRRRTEGIRRRQHDRPAGFLAQVGNFSDGCGLSAAVDANHQDNQRVFLAQLISFSLIHQIRNNAFQRLLHFLRFRNVAGVHPFPELFHDLLGGINSDIRNDQGFFQLIQKILIQIRVAHDYVGNLLSKFRKG